MSGTAAPWFPWEASSFLNQELTTEQAGALAFILSRTWERGCQWLPDDDATLARVAGVTLQRFQRHIRPALAALFDLSGGAWVHAQLAAAWTKCRNTSAVAAVKGAKGGRSKSLNAKGQGLAGATAAAKQTLESESYLHSTNEGAKAPPDAGEGRGPAEDEPADLFPDVDVSDWRDLDLSPDAPESAEPAPPPAPPAPPPPAPLVVLDPVEPLPIAVQAERMVVRKLEAAGVPDRQRYSLMNRWKRELGGKARGGIFEVARLIDRSEHEHIQKLVPWMEQAVAMSPARLQGVDGTGEGGRQSRPSWANI